MTPAEAMEVATAHLPPTKAIMILSLHDDDECFATFSSMTAKDFKTLLSKAIYFYLKRIKGN